MEVHTIWLHSKPVVICQYFFFFTLQVEPYCQTTSFSLVGWFYLFWLLCWFFFCF